MENRKIKHTASMLAQKLQMLSGGDIRCTLFANGTMGSELELGQKVQQGTLDMAPVSSSNVGALAPSANSLNLLYLFDSLDSLMGEKGYLRAESPFLQPLSERILKESGRLRLPGAGTNGLRLLFSGRSVWPQAYMASEQIVDILAKKMDMDPFDFRYLNVAVEGETCTTAVPYRE